MPNVTTEDLYQIIGLKDVQLTVASGQIITLQRELESVRAELATVNGVLEARRRRRRTAE